MHDGGALRALIRDHCRAAAGALTAVAGVMRLTLRGTPPQHWQILRDADIWQEQAAEIARETGVLWLDKLVLDLDPPGGQDGTGGGSAGATAELSAIMVAIRQEPGFAATARTTIDEVIADLPPAVRARLVSGEDAARRLAQRLSDDGARRVLAQMNGSESQ